MNCLFQSTKVIELGSCAFRQPNAHGTRCQLLHGYKLTAKFWFGASTLDERNWVVNFGGLKDLKELLQKQFDHTLVVDGKDPLLPLFKQLHEAGGCDLRVMESGVGIERTAEYCGRVADAWIREQTNNRCWVEKVEVFEHELNSAIYLLKHEESAATTQPVEANQAQSTTQSPTVSVITKNSVPAAVGNVVTSGKSNWFAGTTWGDNI